MRLHPALCVLGTSLLATACGFNFQTESQVLDRRIVGIAAEPPEVILDPANPGPALATTIQVSALVVDPKDTGAPQSFTWSWCLPDLNQSGGYDPVAGRCIEQADHIAAQGTATLAQMGTPFQLATALTELGSGTGGMGLGGLGGQSGAMGMSLPTDDLSTYLMFQLDVAGDASSKGPLFGIKRVVLSTPGPGNRQPNHNPHLTALLFDDTPWEPGTPRAVQLKHCSADQQTQVNDPAKGAQAKATVCEHRITPVFDASQAETYQVQTLDKAPNGQYKVLTLQEVLSFGWLSTEGTFTAEFTGQNTNLGPQSYDPTSTKWIEPPELTDSTVTFWIIVQDDRGGESWETRQLSLTQ